MSNPAVVPPQTAVAEFVTLTGTLADGTVVPLLATANGDGTFSLGSSGGGGGGGAVTIADAADTAQGAIADAAVTGDNAGTVNAHLRGATKTLGDPGDAAWSGTGNGAGVSIWKAIWTRLGFSQNAGTVDATTLRVITASDGPLNTNLGTTADAAVVTDTTGSISGKIRGLVKWAYERMPAALGAGGGLKVDGSGTALPVSGTVTVNAGTNLNTSALATAAKQPTLGTAGTPSADVISVQGEASMTPLQEVGNVASGAADSGNPVKIGGRYNTTKPTLTDAQRGDNQLDVNANLYTREAYAPAYEDNTNAVAGVMVRPVNSATYASTPFQDFGSATTLNVKNTAGNVYALRATNANASARYIQLHNTATTPAGGATAQLSYLVPAGTAAAPGVLELDSSYFAPSERFGTGIAFAWSTTASTYTAATAGDHTTALRYV
jgi:hypothetical protein